MTVSRTVRMSTIVATMALTTLFTLSGPSARPARADGAPAAQPATVAAQPVQVAQPVAAPVAAQPAQPMVYVQQQPAYVQQPQQPAGDPYGFTNWLNSVRARYGLPAVGYDPNLANWAAANSAQQAARGLGHFVMGPARFQNSAMGSSASIGSQWMSSPAHRAALLDPTIRWIGLAGYGAYWTFNAY